MVVQAPGLWGDWTSEARRWIGDLGDLVLHVGSMKRSDPGQHDGTIRLILRALLLLAAAALALAEVAWATVIACVIVVLVAAEVLTGHGHRGGNGGDRRIPPEGRAL